MMTVVAQYSAWMRRFAWWAGLAIRTIGFVRRGGRCGSIRRTMVGFTPMEICNFEIAPGLLVVTIAGQVMMGSESEQITTLVSDLLRNAKPIIIFNLADVTRIDSTGIGRFISSYNEIAAAGGEMRIAAARRLVFQAFHVCRLDTVFRFYPTVDEACKPVSRMPNAEQNSNFRR